MRNPRRAMAAAVLGFECIVLALVTPVLISVEDVSPSIAVSIGIGSAVTALVIAGLLRFEWAYWLGFALQVFAIGLGFLVVDMFVLGLIFGALWTTAYVLGHKIESEQRRR
jgi:Protein of unknown function (DUF4233)